MLGTRTTYCTCSIHLGSLDYTDVLLKRQGTIDQQLVMYVQLAQYKQSLLSVSLDVWSISHPALLD